MIVCIIVLVLDFAFITKLYLPDIIKGFKSIK